MYLKNKKMTTRCGAAVEIEYDWGRLLSQERTIAVKQIDNNGPHFYIVTGPCLTYRFVFDELIQQGAPWNLNLDYLTQTTEVQFDLNSTPQSLLSRT